MFSDASACKSNEDVPKIGYHNNGITDPFALKAPNNVGPF